MRMTDLQNPFSLEPIERPACFFGREKETRQSLGLLGKEQSVYIVGPAKSGKTSFLFHVAHSDVRAQYGLAQKQVFVHLEGRSLADCEQDQCYRTISEEIARQVRQVESIDKASGVELEKVAREIGVQPSYRGLEILFKTLQVQGVRLVMLLDDFEFLTRNPRLDVHFFSALRSLANLYRTAYLIASRFPLYELERIRSGSPFFNIFQPVTLNPLTPQESQELVTTLLEHVGVEFPQFILDCILESANGEPSRLQQAGHLAFQMWQENEGRLEAKHCEMIKRRIANDKPLA